MKELKEYCKKNNIKVPTKAKKKDIIDLLQNIISQPEFTDRTQNQEDQNEVQEENPESQNEMEEELIAGFDEDQQTSELFQKDKTDIKFWQTPKYKVLLDLDLAKDSQIAFYDLATLIDEFFKQMLNQDLINYKISGIALRTSANLHHYKISSIIREEEEIQRKEEIEKLRATHSRTIPKTLPQPINPKLTIATKDELFEAMRSAIIETMQKKEKLRRQRIRREEIKQKKFQRISQAKLPKELLKHITGKEQTIEELHDSWYNRIKGIHNLNNKFATFFELSEIIKNEEQNDIDKKFSFVRMFLALMFLSSGTKLILSQSEEFKDIEITLK